MSIKKAAKKVSKGKKAAKKTMKDEKIPSNVKSTSKNVGRGKLSWGS